MTNRNAGFRRGARPVADLVSKLLDPVIEQRAGMTSDLVASWAEIAGERHARFSMPEKFLWPRRAHEEDPFEPATLVVACEGGHALYLQHDSESVIGRINGYFGFAAVGRIKLVQKPVSNNTPRQRVGQKTANAPQVGDGAARLEAMLEKVSDPVLRQALEKMGRGVFSAGSDKKK